MKPERGLLVIPYWLYALVEAGGYWLFGFTILASISLVPDFNAWPAGPSIGEGATLLSVSGLMALGFIGPPMIAGLLVEKVLQTKNVWYYRLRKIVLLILFCICACVWLLLIGHDPIDINFLMLRGLITLLIGIFMTGRLLRLMVPDQGWRASIAIF
ncbi:MAG: hypothetical protein AAB515_03865 [Patescibacteria group bacterium]